MTAVECLELALFDSCRDKLKEEMLKYLKKEAC